jgi:hypothetical protein
VALRASGVREVVKDNQTGYMLPPGSTVPHFARQLGRLSADPKLRRKFSEAAQQAATEFSRENCAKRALAFYEEIRKNTRRERLLASQHPWVMIQERLGVEWNILTRNARALSTALAS